MAVASEGREGGSGRRTRQPEAATRRKTNAVVLGHRDRRSRDLETGIPKPQPLFPRALRKKKHPHPPSGPDKLAAVAAPGPERRPTDPQYHPASRGLSRLASCVVLLINLAGRYPQSRGMANSNQRHHLHHLAGRRMKTRQVMSCPWVDRSSGTARRRRSPKLQNTTVSQERETKKERKRRKTGMPPQAVGHQTR